MSTIKHPVTGVILNAIPIHRSRSLTPAERETAAHLLAAGDPRWLAGARLGCHPLALKRDGTPKRKGRKPAGRQLSARAAASDPRQIDLEDAIRSAASKQDEALPKADPAGKG